MTKEEAKQEIIRAWDDELQGKLSFTDFFHACADCEQANFRIKYKEDTETKEEHLQVACFCGMRHTDVDDWPAVCMGAYEN